MKYFQIMQCFLTIKLDYYTQFAQLVNERCKGEICEVANNKMEHKSYTVYPKYHSLHKS